MEKKIPLLVLAGPTASGKSALAVRLAERFHGEVIGADSMQIYQKLSVGTARPTAAEMRGIPHHLIGFLDPAERFSVGHYVPLANETALAVSKKGKLPILCGGTGLYLTGVLDHLSYGAQATDPVLRQRLADEYDAHGGAALWERLRQADEKAAAAIHPNNRQRLIRALELLELTGYSITAQNAASHTEESPFLPVCVAVDFIRKEEHWRQIEKRTEKMLENGLLDEAKWLLEHAPKGTAAQAIAYKECFPYLLGEATLAECQERLNLATRQYAKRQRTWFRRDKRYLWLCRSADEPNVNFQENVIKMVETLATAWYNK